MNGRLVLVLAAILFTDSRRSAGALPHCLDPDLHLERIATSPDIVTPIGCAVDSAGRVFVLESHTHFPKADYPGASSDRIKFFPIVPGHPPTLFAEGIRWGMNLAVGPEGTLYLTHRNGVIRYSSPQDSGRASGQRDVVVMETAGDYPHNGMGGIAFGPDGWLYLGTGENLGLAYVLRGSDGSRLALPAGAGGVIVRCRPDGSQLERFAKGFWNAFGLTFDGSGRLFMVDNDPDSRPPCRLVHVIRNGDYGFQFRHGRDGLSPLIAWNGELPGTLGMVSGTGEAPSSVLDSARTRFPSRYDRTLLVASAWEHQVELYRPVPVGASFRSGREALVTGDENFRPVSLAAAPDGSVVFTDWVKSDYSVHGQGSVWRLSARKPASSFCRSLPEPAPAEIERLRLESADPNSNFDSLLSAVGSQDPFVRSTAVSRLETLPELRLMSVWALASARVRAGLLLAVRSSLARRTDPSDRETFWMRRGFQDPDPEVRLAALVWAVEEGRRDLVPEISGVLVGTTPTPLLAEVQGVGLRSLQVTRTAATAGLITESDAIQTVTLVVELNAEQVRMATQVARDRKVSPFLRVEAIRDLAGTRDSAAVLLLQQVAVDRTESSELRAEAVLSLTGSHDDHVSVLRGLLKDPEVDVSVEVARALQAWRTSPQVRSALEAVSIADRGDSRLAETSLLSLGRPGSRPSTEADWKAAIEAAPGDPVSGGRIFRSPAVACARCHRIEGRGGSLGPDLSTLSRGASRDRILGSLLEPSRDIAPQFVDHQVETVSGEVLSGRMATEAADGSVTLLNGNGQQTRIPRHQIRSDRPVAVSLMPEGLLDALTLQDVRDLMAFLESRK